MSGSCKGIAHRNKRPEPINYARMEYYIKYSDELTIEQIAELFGVTKYVVIATKRRLSNGTQEDNDNTSIQG